MSLLGMRFDSKHDFTPPTILLGLLLALGHRISFFGGILHSPVDGRLAVSCNFGVFEGKDEHMSLYSAILRGKTLLKSLMIIVLGEKFPKIIKLRHIKHLGFPSD